jgi:hypothetical protein
MPSYVIMQQSAGRIGDTVEAILCDLNAAGSPDRGTDVPVRVRRISEKTLYVDDEPRGLFGAWGKMVPSPFWLMAAKASAIANGASPWRKLRGYYSN